MLPCSHEIWGLLLFGGKLGRRVIDALLSLSRYGTQACPDHGCCDLCRATGLVDARVRVLSTSEASDYLVSDEGSGGRQCLELAFSNSKKRQ
jgi:hypothetical protein